MTSISAAVPLAIVEERVVPQSSERPAQKDEAERTRRISFWIVFAASVLNGVAFAIVIPTCNAYVKSVGSSATLAGLMVGLNPLTQGFLNIPLAKVLKIMSLKSMLLLGCVTSFAGNAIYALAGFAESPAMLFAGRIVIGLIGFSQLASTFVARAYDTSWRSAAMARMKASLPLSYAIAPGLAFLVEQMCIHLQFNGTVLNNFSMPAWVLMVLSLALFVVVSLAFEEPPSFAGSTAAHARIGGTATCLQWLRMSGAYVPNVAVAIVVSVWEIHSVLIAQMEWGWSKSDSALYLLGNMIVMFASALWGVRLAKLVSDYVAVMTMSSVGLLGASVLLVQSFTANDWNTLQILLYSAGSIVILNPLMIQRIFTESLVTKMAPRSRQQEAIALSAFLMGVSRFLGSTFASMLPQDRSFSCFVASVICFSFLVLLAVGRFLQPEVSNNNRN